MSEHVSAEARANLGKICGMLGSEHEGERSNALQLLGRVLANNGLSFAWLSEIVAHGVLPGGDREKLLHRLAGERLAQGLQHAWAMMPEEAFYVRNIAGRADLTGTEPDAIRRAIEICDQARGRANAPGRGAPKAR